MEGKTSWESSSYIERVKANKGKDKQENRKAGRLGQINKHAGKKEG